jgi:O-antigen/teichoic acid export membrane protein
VHVLLARWLSTDDYGVFVISFSLLLLATALHNALVAEPVLVFGAGRYSAGFASYLRGALVAHGLATGALCLLLCLGGLVLLCLNLSDLGRALLVLSAAQPFILLLGFARRACYARFRARAAAFGSSIYLLVVLPSVAILSKVGALGVGSALTAMGAAGLLSGGLTCWLLLRTTPSRGSIVAIRDLVREHWAYGRWILATSFTAWVPFNIYYLLLPGAAGLGAVAALRAMENLFAPMLRLTAPVHMLLIPRLAGNRNLRASLPIHAPALVLGATACAYWLVLALFQGPIVDLLYGGRYGHAPYLVLCLGVVPVFEVMGGVWRAALKAFERPVLVFRSLLYAVVPGVATGVLLLDSMGAVGAAVGLLVFSGVSAGVACVYCQRESRLRRDTHPMRVTSTQPDGCIAG